MSQLESLYRFSDLFDLTADILKKDIPSFFLKDVDRVLYIGKLLVKRLEGYYDVLYLGFPLLEFVQLFRRGPGGFGRELPVQTLDLFLEGGYIKDNLGALRSSP